MLRRTIYFLLVAVLIGGLGSAIAYYAFAWKPQFLAQVISAAPKPTETISAEPARADSWQPQVGAIGTLVAVNGIDVTAGRLHLTSSSTLDAVSGEPAPPKAGRRSGG